MSCCAQRRLERPGVAGVAGRPPERLDHPGPPVAQRGVGEKAGDPRVKDAAGQGLLGDGRCKIYGNQDRYIPSIRQDRGPTRNPRDRRWARKSSPFPQLCRVASGGCYQGMGFRLFIEGFGR
jgi:hypothetical protein